MRRIAFGCIVLLLAAAVLSAGCTNVSNPSPSPRPDYSANFARSIESLGWTPIHPISKTADNVYSGSYRNNARSDLTFNVTIEIARSEAAAKEHYDQLVIGKQNEGYTNQTSRVDTANFTIWDVKGSWVGYRSNSLISAPTYTSLTYAFFYGYNTGISEWVVGTVFADVVLET